ncbi:glutamate receptor ionotropic, delta-2-like [Cherax quadricarinatus]|uniref:glutamate receptor ionotropic, delta-2-like n=1 Tax=Cherax quadricarinatus TaxID=27406 RepID=UPI00387E4BBC
MACCSVLESQVKVLKKGILLLQEENRRLKLHLDGSGSECEMDTAGKEEMVTSSESGSRYKWQILKHKYVFVNAQLNSRLTATKRGRGNFYIARQTFLPQGYGIACPTGSPYKDVFSSVIIRLIEGGLVYKWAEDEVKKVAKNNSPSGGSRIAAINLHQLQAAFFILLMGFAISALVLGSEIIGNRARQNDIDTTLVHK